MNNLLLICRIPLNKKNFENSDIKIDRIWNLSAVPKLTEFVYAVIDEDRRVLVEDVIKNFVNNVVPQYEKLIHGAIHGDMNEQNILGTSYSSFIM